MSLAFIILAVLVTTPALPLSIPATVAAQTAPATPTPPGTVWQARVVSNSAWATSGTGSIFRVRVVGRPGANIEVRRLGEVLSAPAGSKPEYGPDAAEFAPLPKGMWEVVVPELNLSLEVWADGTNLAVIEFVEVPAWQATATAAVTPPAPTPLAGLTWQGRIVSESSSETVAGSIIRVRVVDQVGLGVGLATPVDLIGANVTGFKADELGPDVTEFVALSEGDYIITPAGLNTELRVSLKPLTRLVVEFAPVLPTPTPTATAPVPTPRPGTPTATATATPSPTPTPTPRPQWIAAVERREPVAGPWSSVVVRVDGLAGTPVTISAGNFEATCLTGSKEGYGDFACELGGLAPGRYDVSVPALELALPLSIPQAEFIAVGFRQEPPPPEPLIWQTSVEQNTNGPVAAPALHSAVAVVVEGRAGQVVRLANARGFEAFCETGTKPEYGPFACEFGGLWPGVYTISPANLPVSYSLFVDGSGFALISFAARPAPTATPSPAATPLLGQGAVPKRSETGSGAQPATPTPTRRVTPTATRRATSVTPTPTPSATLTPTPAYAWVGRVLEESQTTPGTLVVRALGLKDHPVRLQSGSWQISGLTGTKPEQGDFAVEFAGLAPGQYLVVLEGLAELPVQLKPGYFMLVEFRYEVASAPPPTVERRGWVGAITANTNGDSPAGGVWSIVLVKVAGSEGLPVRIFNDGFATECITGTKPEFGPGACQVGGLWPGAYRVQPEGIPASVDVYLDGQGAATIEFWQQ